MKRSRPGVVIVLVISLIAAGVMRGQAMRWQEQQASGRPGGNLGSALGGMNSFALALLLGGLRGPLVMFLWSTSESQKTDRNLEDFDTKIEWIRLLQPEFDTVHMFQIWNKAYNISVMMASPANKYITVMQALDYAHNIDQQRPGDINILSSVEQVYANKLGGIAVQEKAFYDRQFRQETMTDNARRAAYPEEKQFRRLWTAPREDRGAKTIGVMFLDDQNRIQPQLIEPERSRPENVKGEWNDGSPLQYLAPYQPFSYGIPALAMAYNYAKRAQVAMSVEGQKPLQLSGMVIDSQPALQLHGWGTAEAKRARSLEAKAFKIEAPAVETPASDKVAASVGLATAPADRHALDAAIYSYGLAARLADDARREYERHLAQREFLNRFQTYASHLDDVENDALLARADHDYLLAVSQTGSRRSELLNSARELYRKAALQSKRIVLKYYMEEALRPLLARMTGGRPIASLADETMNRAFDQLTEAADRLPSPQYADDRVDYYRVVNRSQDRIELIDRALSHTAGMN